MIEVDGDSHYSATGEQYDERRTAALEAEGIEVMRFTNSEVMEQFEAVCRRIADRLGLSRT